jgi:mannitol-1-phosphate 5-dehydrogenase
MLNPFLKDTVERVGRDPVRKLGWDDRLIGTLRMAMRQGVEPRRYAFGAAAALSLFVSLNTAPSEELRSVLTNLWTESHPDLREEQQVIQRIQTAWEQVKRWRKNQYSGLRELFQ